MGPRRFVVFVFAFLLCALCGAGMFGAMLFAFGFDWNPYIGMFVGMASLVLSMTYIVGFMRRYGEREDEE